MPIETTPNHKHKVAKLAEQLAQFDSLPNAALVGIAVVCVLLGRSKASIYRDVRNERIPAPAKAGPRCTRWQVGKLRQHLAGGAV